MEDGEGVVQDEVVSWGEDEVAWVVNCGKTEPMGMESMAPD